MIIKGIVTSGHVLAGTLALKTVYQYVVDYKASVARENGVK